MWRLDDTARLVHNLPSCCGRNDSHGDCRSLQCEDMRTDHDVLNLFNSQQRTYS
jgi:hypothetical protein